MKPTKISSIIKLPLHFVGPSFTVVMTEIVCSLSSPLLHLYVYISIINAQTQVWVSGDCA